MASSGGLRFARTVLLLSGYDEDVALPERFSAYEGCQDCGERGLSFSVQRRSAPLSRHLYHRFQLLKTFLDGGSVLDV